MAGHSGGAQAMDLDSGPSTWRPSSPSAPPAKHRRVHRDEAEPELHRIREGNIVHILSDSSESSDCVVVEQRVRGAADGSTGSRRSSEAPEGRASDEPLPRPLAANPGTDMQQIDAHSGPEGESVREEKGARPQASSGVLRAEAATTAAAAAEQRAGEQATEGMGIESGSLGPGSCEEGVQQTHTEASPCEGPGHGVLTAAQGVAASLPAAAAEPNTTSTTSQHQENSLAPADAAAPIRASGSTAPEGDVSDRLQACVAEQRCARVDEREETREPLLRALATGPSEFWAASLEVSRKLEQAAAVAGPPPEASEGSDASERAAVPLREAASPLECEGQAPAHGTDGSGSPAAARGAASSIGDRSMRADGRPPPRGVAQIPTVELPDGTVYPSPRQQSELLQQLAAADFNYDPHSRELRHRFLPVYRRLFRELSDSGTSKPDMQAFSKVVGGTADPADRNAFMDQNRARYGHPRGVRVGEKFSGRVELAVLGIHCMPMSGIDWRRLSNAGFPPAMDAVVQRSLKDAPEPPGGDATDSRMAPVFAICLAGQYVDDKDDGSSFEYTGMGGRRRNSKIQTEDQGWHRGNQGLWWNHQMGLPVRVARLFGDSGDERNSRTYVYEGLYYVAGAWEAASAHNSHKVIKFRMVGVPRHHTKSVHVQWNQQALKKRFITQRLIAAPAGREEEEDEEEEEEDDDDDNEEEDDEGAGLLQEKEGLGGKHGRGRIAGATPAQGQELRGGADGVGAQQQSQAKAAGQHAPPARRGRPPASARPRHMVWGYAARPAALQELLLERVQQLQTLPHLLSADISNGSEIIPIPAFNEVDDEPLPDFQYIASHEQRQPRFLSDAARELLGQVAEKQLEVWGCAGRFRSRKVPWYSKRNGLMQETHWRGVPECRAGCQAQGCPGTRVVSAGLRYPLEVFKTPNGRGWGVRCSAEIPVGAFIGVTYTGRVITDREAEQLEGCDRYFFGLDHFTSLYHEGHIVLDTGKLTPEAQLEDSKPCAFRLVPPMPTRLNWPSLFYGLGAGDSVEDLDINHLVLDASGMGSAARFLNHSCNPNLVQQPVLLEGDSAFFYHVAFFAAKLIPPGEELTYDYGYKDGLAGSVAVKCLCGAAECRGRLL